MSGTPSRTTGWARLLAAVSASVLVLGCEEAGSRDGDVPSRELLLFCGAGLRPPVAELAETFGRRHGITVVPDYAGSEVLLSRIKLAERGDVYLPGDKHYVDLAAEQAMVRSRRPVCYFVPTILVRKGNPRGIAGLEDLLGEDVKLGLGDERSCAIGRKSRKIFEKNGLSWSDVEPHVKFKSATVNELGVQIQVGSLDAVIVWDAVAAQYARHGDQVPIPVEQNVISTVEIAVLKFTSNAESADRFVAFVTSEEGRAVFAKHGYSTATVPDT